MRCDKCNNKLSLNLKTGELYCSYCDSNKKQKLILQKIKFNQFIFYKVIESENIKLNNDYILIEDLEKMIKEKNLTIKIKEIV